MVANGSQATCSESLGRKCAATMQKPEHLRDNFRNPADGTLKAKWRIQRLHKVCKQTCRPHSFGGVFCGDGIPRVRPDNVANFKVCCEMDPKP